jgi:hypothetical protein
MSLMSFNYHHHRFHPLRFTFGTNDDDVLNGTHYHDFIFGFDGDDQIFANHGHDTVFGGRGNDLIRGGRGNDTLFGNRGNDGLAGDEGNDHLQGGDGRDFIVGGAGRDELEGDAGPDRFVLRQGTGVDTISDLQSNDRIDVRDFGFASADEVLAALRQRGHDAVLDLGNGDRLIIEDTRASELTAWQFIVSDTETGPSSSQSPYVLPIDDDVSTASLLTVGDMTSDGSGWQMVGIPDGIGAFDNGDGTFTVLMNHELGPTQGVARDHGGTGAFVSRLVVDSTTLEVLSGSDLIQHVFLYDRATNTYYDPVADGDPATTPYTFDRLCSADLPELTAFYNPDTGIGYNGRIFMGGEETGPPFSPVHGRAFAHFVTGSEAGNSYEIPWLGRMAFENAVANPDTGDTTVIALTDDATPGQLYFYFGDRQANGSAIEQAGLVGGTLFGLRIDELNNLIDNNNESNGTTLGGDFQSTFSLVNLGDASEIDGAALQTQSETLGVTEFLRPEDSAWDPLNSDTLYFVTTNAFGSPSRLWSVEFDDPTSPSGGGTIRMLLDGTEGQQMLDNITVNEQGHVIMQEDPGNNPHLARIWEYDPLTDQLRVLAQHDPDRFDPAAPVGGEPFLTQDEESSGIIDVTDILGSGGQNAYLYDVQAHYNIAGELVQGGQLGMLFADLL